MGTIGLGLRALTMLCLALSMPTLAAKKDVAGEGKPLWLDPAQLQLKVSIDGNARDVACGPDVAPMICPLLLRAVPRWKFAPGMIAGVATEMEISLRLDLVAVPKAGGFGVQALRAWIYTKPPLASSNIDPETQRLNPPRYPYEHLRKGRTGVVVMELWPQADSEYARVGQVWFDRQPSSRKNDFVTATLDAAAKWKVKRGAAQQLSFCESVEYTLEKMPRGRMDDSPCVPTYVEGYAPPKLMTDVATVAF